MEVHQSRSQFSTVLLCAALVAVAVVPAALASESAATPTRLVVGFENYPLTLAEGDLYDGALVVRSIPQLSALAVLTLDPLGFSKRQLASENVRYVENDDPLPLLLDERRLPPPQDGPVSLFTPNDPQFGSMYGPQQVRAPAAWDTTLGDNDAAVCVIDTGVRRTHEDLGTARYLGGHDYVNNDADPADDQGHGTHVAGTAVGAVNNGIGVAGMGNLPYYAVKVLDAAGSGSWSNVAAGITWCADNGIANTVLSLSLGGGGGATVLADAVHYAFATKNKLVVAASGNGGCDNCVLYPGAYPEAIGVACTTSTQASCSFTSKGPEVDVAAPGDGVVSTCFGSDTEYCTKSGTSMSTPHASGVIALAWSHHSSMAASCVWQRVNNTVDDLGTLGKDTAFGWGRMNASKLVADTDCPAPPPPPPQLPFLTYTFDASSSLPMGWTGTGLWHVSTCKAYSTANSLAYNKNTGCPPNYDTGAANSGDLTTEAVTIPAAQAASMQFRSRYATESGTSYDKKLVLVSNNGGSTFNQIFQENGAQNAWNDITVDLTAYAGQSILVRFRFDTVDHIANAYEGWYVDDVTFLASDANATVPGVPTNLAATAGVGQISLSWAAPAFNGGAPITLYKVYRAPNASGPYVHTGSSATTSFVNTGLPEGTTYHYKVSAVNAVGEGNLSTSVSATTFSRPTAPRNLDAEPGGALFTIDLDWDAPTSNGGTPITQYKIYRNGVLTGTSTTTAYRDTNLDPTRAYDYTVSAVNAVGEGPLSNEACSRPNPWPELLQAMC